MKRKNKAFILIVTLILALSSVTGVAFAEVDYNQWNSQSTYPQDVVGTPLFAAVKFLIDKKVLTGYSDGTFKPENYITRAEIAVAVAKMTNRTNDLENMAKENKFSDLTGYDWAKGYINAAADGGLIKGITSTTFEPGRNINYAELITMLIRTKSGAASELEGYGTWPNNYIQYAQMYNMLGDVAVSDWNAPATRGDTAKLMYRMMPK
ncbi:MAG TPA: S-layer homology domain-containing protein [Patescibacteria group bacterium]|nr:S-layer homology domain-containing protein [Patescibacteria group bacterium]